MIGQWVFHRDILNPKGEKIKQPISIKNLNDALTYAEQDIKGQMGMV